MCCIQKDSIQLSWHPRVQSYGIDLFLKLLVGSRPATASIINGINRMRVEDPVGIGNLRFRELPLMDGEHVDSILNVSNVKNAGEDSGADVIVLTNKRIIQTGSDRRVQKVIFTSLKDVDTIEVTRHSKGYGGYVWGVLAVVASLGIWQVWDSTTWSPIIALAVLLVGVYLVVDHVITPRSNQAMFKTSASTLQCDIDKEENSVQVYTFINRLFQLKTDIERNVNSDSRYFSPR